MTTLDAWSLLCELQGNSRGDFPPTPAAMPLRYFPPKGGTDTSPAWSSAKQDSQGRSPPATYPFTPPAVRPETIQRCRNWNNTITGTAKSKAPAV